eukprot:CAMPEP_0172169912 /NCGR_PEP_ID=MMETSP1050-20130122/10975_1 /TAXON_ID=233186 /ORGANISM="Cryptomonas curvata, Strain CCAP979/52" /LENGTH=243 /DNA_ID=CAMNT_0012841035 /DNA_START=13 /DNA_END=742 /DNA_ORIENTATION=-
MSVPEEDPVGKVSGARQKDAVRFQIAAYLCKRIECDLMTATLEGSTLKIEIGEKSAGVSIFVELDEWSDISLFSKSCDQCFRLENAEDVAADVQEKISKLLEITFNRIQADSGTPFWNVLLKIVLGCSDALNIQKDDRIAAALDHIRKEQHHSLDERLILKNRKRPAQGDEHPDTVIINDDEPSIGGRIKVEEEVWTEDAALLDAISGASDPQPIQSAASPLSSASEPQRSTLSLPGGKQTVA